MLLRRDTGVRVGVILAPRDDNLTTSPQQCSQGSICPIFALISLVSSLLVPSKGLNQSDALSRHPQAQSTLQSQCFARITRAPTDSLTTTLHAQTSTA